MCWQCENPDKTMGDYLDALREMIATHGWAVQFVESDRNPFAYTIGLHDRGLPELLTTGLAPQRACWLLNTFARRTLSGRRLVPGRQIFLSVGARVEPVAVGHPDAHLEMANAIEGPDVTAVQLVWADDRGRWPWAPEFDDGIRRQPVLGVRANGSHRGGA
jgi:uncharacterized protein DUF4262